MKLLAAVVGGLLWGAFWYLVPTPAVVAIGRARLKGRA